MKVKILLIEDDAIIRLTVSERLNKAGFEVIEAKDGETGLELLKSELPTLIVCDINLPDIDGFDILEALRCNPDTAQIRFIFFSSNTDRSYYRKALQLGANDFLDKGVREREFLEAIHLQIRVSSHSKVACPA